MWHHVRSGGWWSWLPKATWVVNLKGKCPKVTDKQGGAMWTQLVPGDPSPESAAGTGQCRPFHLPTVSKGAWWA